MKRFCLINSCTERVSNVSFSTLVKVALMYFCTLCRQLLHAFFAKKHMLEALVCTSKICYADFQSRFTIHIE